MPPSHLYHIESEFCFYVSRWTLFIGYNIPEFALQFRIVDRHYSIDADRVSHIVRGIVRELSKSESIFIRVMRFRYQCLDKIPGSHIVEEVTEKFARERIISHILNDAAAIRIGVRFSKLVCG